MKKITKKELLNHLNYAIGHLEGIKKMVESDAYCIDILQQTRAVSSTLRKVDQLLLSNHLKSCVHEAMRENKTRKMNKTVKELVEIYKYA